MPIMMGASRSRVLGFNRGYNHDNSSNHPCATKWCTSCHREDRSQRLNDCWVQANSLHTLFFALCVIDLSLARTVTLTIFIAAEKTFHPSHLQQMHLQELHIASHQCYMQRIPEEEDE